MNNTPILLDKNLYLPPSVIRQLAKYQERGCKIKIIEDELDGKNLLRWIVNDVIIVHTSEAEDCR